MLIKTTISALLGLALVAEAASIHQAHPHRSPIGLVRRQNGKKGGNNNNNNNNNAQANAGGNANAASLTLLANAIQTGSQSTGQQNGVAADGQVNSKTDNANFINVCAGKTLTNGLQLKTGSCNGIPMGDIPATTNMVSTVITNPKNNDVITAQKTFDITVSVKGMQLGAFTNATSTYYSAPQALNGGGQIIGHTHVTVQNTGNTLQPTTPLDPVQFVFFKGINDAGDGNGNLKATVTGGLPAGNYRVCTITSAANHQPVVMPVAQRGAQEDCRYFTAGAATGNNNNNNNANTGANQGNNNAGKGGANAGTAGGAANQGKTGTTGKGNNTGSTATAGGATATGGATTGGNNGATTGAATGTAKALGGIAAPAVTNSSNKDRPFSVNGDTFVNKAAAVQRSCAIQNNGCSDAINLKKATGFTLADCNKQEIACRAAGGA